jgi:hypothetical protein
MRRQAFITVQKSSRRSSGGLDDRMPIRLWDRAVTWPGLIPQTGERSFDKASQIALSAEGLIDDAFRQDLADRMGAELLRVGGTQGTERALECGGEKTRRIRVKGLVEAKRAVNCHV